MFMFMFARFTALLVNSVPPAFSVQGHLHLFVDVGHDHAGLPIMHDCMMVSQLYIVTLNLMLEQVP